MVKYHGSVEVICPCSNMEFMANDIMAEALNKIAVQDAPTSREMDRVSSHSRQRWREAAGFGGGGRRRDRKRQNPSTSKRRYMTLSYTVSGTLATKPQTIEAAMGELWPVKLQLFLWQ
eukprot:GILJ01029648.1.p1 GENE.GILJ01029648.1~~GILJ01029648.1.p1  ORF type:complete len:118 (+),score=4.65 GILJ01029648.1:146-499(+)